MGKSKKKNRNKSRNVARASKENKGKVSRRRFFGILAGATLAGIVSSPALNILGQTEAERALDTFPDRIPGAISVDKYRTDGAKHCLVHIRQVHEGGKETMETVQNNIYRILTNLSHTTGIDSIYLEGFSDRQIEKANMFYQKVKVQAVEVQSNPRAKYGFTRAAFELGLKLRSAEDLDLAKEAMQMHRNMKKDRSDLKTANRFASLNEERELYAMEKIASSGDPLAILVYGGAHSFGGKKSCGEDYVVRVSGFPDYDNIHEWNVARPGKSFSLIEVTPKGFPEGDIYNSNPRK